MKKHRVKEHHRRAPVRKPKAAPAPGQHEFSPDEEMQMRAGQRAANAMPPAAPDDMDEDAGMPGGL